MMLIKENNLHACRIFFIFRKVYILEMISPVTFEIYYKKTYILNQSLLRSRF